MAGPAPATKKFPPPIPHVRAPGSVLEEDIAAVKLPSPKKRRRSLKQSFLLAILVVVLAGGGFYAYRVFLAPPPPPPPKPAAAKPLTPKPVANAANAASTVLNKIVDAPGKLIESGQQAIAQHRAEAQDRVDEAATGNDATDKHNADAGKPAAEPLPATATSQIAPGVTATVAVGQVEGGASAAFRTWVANVQIGGVFNGATARVLLNGRTYRAGQVVDDTLGIVFEKYDETTKSIIFRDKSGATVSRHF